MNMVLDTYLVIFWFILDIFDPIRATIKLGMNSPNDAPSHTSKVFFKFIAIENAASCVLSPISANVKTINAISAPGSLKVFSFSCSGVSNKKNIPIIKNINPLASTKVALGSNVLNQLPINTGISIIIKEAKSIPEISSDFFIFVDKLNVSNIVLSAISKRNIVEKEINRLIIFISQNFF